MLPIRVFFKKKGALAYISHLDLNRAVIRAFVRSGLPVVYTEGFNPHPRLTFSQPLSLFQESETEIFDFKIDPDMPYEQVKQKLTAALPPLFEVTKVVPPVKKLIDIAFAQYEIRISCAENAEAIKAMFAGEVVVFKSTKSKSEYVNIARQIKNLEAEDTAGGVTLYALLSTSPEDYLNPQYLVDYISGKTGVTDSGITRKKLFDKDMNEFE